MTITDSLLTVLSSHREAVDAMRAATREIIADAPDCEQVQDGLWTVDQAEVFLLADALKDWIGDQIDDMPAATLQDAVRCQLALDAFEAIGWHDLARHCLARVKADDLI